MGIPSIIIMDLTVHKEKVIELGRENSALKQKLSVSKTPILQAMSNEKRFF